MKRPMTITEQRMADMWNAGMKSLAIAIELDMAPSTVTTWRARLGLEARHANPTRYTDDQLSEIQRRYEVTGESCSEIAQALGRGWNKNMVIGVVYRRGLKKPLRPAPIPKAPRVRPPRLSKTKTAAVTPKPFDLSKSKTDSTAEQRAEKAAAGRLIIAAANDAANDNSVLLMERRFGQCAWPVGQPDRPARQLCCAGPVPADANRSVANYCASHAQRAVARVLTGGAPDSAKYERAMRRWAV